MRFVISSYGPTVFIWNGANCNLIRTLQHPSGDVVCVSVSADGGLIVSGDNRIINNIRMWRTETGECIRTFSGCGSWSDSSVAMSLSGAFVAAAGGFENSARIWCVDTGKCIVLAGHVGCVTTVAISGDERFVVSGAGDATVRIWCIATGRCLYHLDTGGSWITSIAISENGMFIAVGARDGSIKMWPLCIIDK